mgnify:CR=1 FL=1
MKMQAIRVAVVASLLALFTLVPALAQQVGQGAGSTAGHDALIRKLSDASPARWDAILEENRAILGPPLVEAVANQAAEALRVGDLSLCKSRVALADEIDYVIGGKKIYRGRFQFDLGRYLINKSKDFEAALSVAADMLSAHPDCASAFLLEGRVHTLQRQFDKAVAELTHAVKLEPDSEVAHLMLAEAYLLSGDNKAALAQFQEVLRINPKNGYATDAVSSLTGKAQGGGTRSKEAQTHFDKAEAQFSAGRFADAAAEYDLAIKADPKYVSAWVYKGDALLQMGDEVGAIGCYRKAAEIDPKNRQAWRFLGDVLEKQYDRNGNPALLDEAISCYEKAIAADPTYATAKDDLARANGKKARRAPR